MNRATRYLTLHSTKLARLAQLHVESRRPAPRVCAAARRPKVRPAAAY